MPEELDAHRGCDAPELEVPHADLALELEVSPPPAEAPLREENPRAAPHAGAAARSSWHGARDFWDWLLYALIFAGFPALLYFTLHKNALYEPIWIEVEAHQWMKLIVRPALLWTFMGSLLLAFRTIFWLRYRPFVSATFAAAPAMTVIIPAYNEGPMVLKAIESAANAGYPRERLEILVVDDGSTDDTWLHIKEAARRYPDVVSPVRLAANGGKRKALALGFRKASGEIVVTLDSDSVIEPNALLAIAGPFREQRVGAVAGKVLVYNRREGLLPRMLHVRFVLAFDLLRAVESSYGNVFCCPGALTAYRTCIVRSVLDRWLAQTFLGAPCTIGEDRAMTNLILESGHDTVYQRSAVVHTVVPPGYTKLCKMLIRWDRSYVREELYFLTVAWKRPLRTRILALCDRLITNLRYPIHYASLFLLIFLAIHHPWMVPRFLLAVGAMSLYNMAYYLRSERSLDICYGVFYSYFELAGLFWIFPFSAATVRSRSWLTR
ncbi:MAG TPA: glycosyltransferase family 2 protein [Candidatus Acidoferrales bacterium]|nr:glycosyltransferase family 2 protein [Candidatus Acidoferrales bacterium]